MQRPRRSKRRILLDGGLDKLPRLREACLRFSHPSTPQEPGGIEPDTTYFEAPVYRDGQVTVGIRRELPRDSIEPVIDSLNAEVLDGYNVNEEERVETWQTSGYVLDSVVARYDDDERFRYVETRRMIEYETIVRTPRTVELPSGLYFYRLQGGSVTRTRTMMLVK